MVVQKFGWPLQILSINMRRMSRVLMSGAAKTSFQRYFVESSEYFVYSILSQKDRIIHLFDSFNQINDAKKELQELLHDETMYSTKGKLLEHNLDPEVRDALHALKQQLKTQ